VSAISTLILLSLIAQAQGGIFDTLFGVVKTVVSNNGMIMVGDIVKNIAMTNMINLPTIPGVDIGGLLNGVGGLVGMKIFGGTPATPTSTAADPESSDAADPEMTDAADPEMSDAGTSNTGSNWFMNFFMPNAGTNTDPSNSWLNILMNGAGLLGNLGGTTNPMTSNPNPDPMVNNDPDPVTTSSSSTKTGVGSPCNGVAGTCLDSGVSTCSASFLTGKCPGPREVRCCPSGGVAGNVMSGGQDPDQPVSSGSGSCSQYGGLVFPLASGSLAEISVNWGGPRSNGARCHAGLDIYTGGARTVVAMSDGVVTAILKNWYSCSGGTIDAIMVYHDSGALAGKTINYGEVNPGTYSLSVGSRVSRGQTMAVARNCGMLHFELYQGRLTANQHWLPASGRVGSGCAGNSLQTKPGALLDPRPIIRCTMPSGARFRNGVGFLNSGELAKFTEDLDEEGDETPTLEVGGIIGIVVAFLVLLALVIGVAVALRMRRARQSAQTMSVSNAAYSTGPAYSTTAPADLGHFSCPQCGKEYNYENDLKIHISTRHTSA
jgi:hypothetical protein